MKSTILICLLTVAYSSSYGADQDARAAYMAARKARLEAEAAGVTIVNAKEDWKGWILKNFPDASRSWPEGCAKSFVVVVGNEKWDFVGKGDIDRDGAPTGLLIRVKPSPDPDRPEKLIVDSLAVMKCSEGLWKSVFQQGGVDMSLSAGDAEDTISPGMTISAALVNEKGRVVSEDEDFYYLPKLGKYGGDADKEALKAGKPGRQKARKAKRRVVEQETP